MRVRDPELLKAHMSHRGFSQARLARYAGTSRQFIHMLTVGEKLTCSDHVGELIEEALGVLPTTLFLPKESPVIRPGTNSRKIRVSA